MADRPVATMAAVAEVAASASPTVMAAAFQGARRDDGCTVRWKIRGRIDRVINYPFHDQRLLLHRFRIAAIAQRRPLGSELARSSTMLESEVEIAIARRRRRLRSTREARRFSTCAPIQHRCHRCRRRLRAVVVQRHGAPLPGTTATYGAERATKVRATQFSAPISRKSRALWAPREADGGEF
jgi:hypothetical protein